MVYRLYWILSVLLTAVLDFVFPFLRPWSVPAVLAFFIALTALSVLFLFLVSLFCYGKKPLSRDHRFCRVLAYHTMDFILCLFRFRVKGENLDRIPSEPCVLVCNHLSRFDPMAIFVLQKGRRLAFVSKKENMKIPIAGPIISKIGFVSLDRENPLRAMRAIHAASKLVSEKGFSMGIFPEGTRSFGGELLEFKSGAFVMAKKAGVPLVICRIRGTNEYKKNLPFGTTPILVEVLETIPAETVKEKKAEELSDYCREAILKA
ncbi:MAG: 1-acyl-sn-glycerol-3-phosphate acyltransferase [Clostridia bacterium]|nr:1-acyl-sn-glycerol-3-phosphate acyltransferase [Clostridia bacterium]